MKKTILLFPGQGSQYPGMGKTLYEDFDVAKDIYDIACEILSFDIKKLSFEGPSEELNLTKNAQPAILIHSAAIMRILDSECGILNNQKALFAAGHSLGEFSALAAAGALRLENAIRLVYLRGKFMQDTCAPGIGAMTAILGLKAPEVSQVCLSVSTPENIVVPANFNSSTQTVISGHAEAVKKAGEICASRNAKVIPLPVSIPSHSPLMEHAALKLSQAIADTEFGFLSFPYIANHDAKLYGRATDFFTMHENLVKQLTFPVRWHETMELFAKQGIEGALEIGPGKVLTGLLKKTNREIPCRNIDSSDDVKAYIGKT